MLQWLSGSSRPSAVQHHGQDHDSLDYDEPPETPAPLFAVRAFKTAIFGTPHPEPKETKPPPKHIQRDKTPREDPSLKDGANNQIAESDHDFCREIPALNKPNSTVKAEAFASPAKGILMTPGTAATRRKTVSFGFGQKPEEGQPLAGKNGVEEGTNKVYTANERSSDDPYEEKPRQSTLTQTLIELSKQERREKSTSAASKYGESKEPASVVDFLTDTIMESHVDNTIDLSQPRSRSGQHWKTEYDQYHRRSNREMKKIIKYGQNVKSYAVKKDSEATNLNEKLKRELARVASMEAKVSKLATQLNNAQSQGLEGDSDQTRLVSELAQQTALAIRYKQRADAYRARLQKLGTKDAFEDIQDEKKEVEGNPHVEQSEQTHEVEMIRAELETLRTTAKAAEKQAERLEKENATLKRSLARVKEEMMSYETRRQAREERLKKREAKHKAARDDCEKRLVQLTVEYEELVRTAEQVPIVDMAAEIRAIQAEASLLEIIKFIELQENNIVIIEQIENPQPPNELPQQPTTYISPRRKRLPKPSIDIWTISSPHEGLNNPTQSQEPTSLPPSSVKHDIHRTLKEIDQNLVPNQYPSEITKHEASPSKPPLPPTLALPAPNAPIDLSKRENVRHIQTRRFTDNSPRPSMISLASSPAKLDPVQHQRHLQPYTKPQGPTVGRSASMMSGVGGRTSTMGSGRGSALPAERAAAAKARLAKRSAEKRTRREVRS